jgi:hypothetical protein
MAVRKEKMRAPAPGHDAPAEYRKIEQIDGTHPLQEAVPFSYMSYPVRRRREGKVVYFNFQLAKEMGLIEKKHPHVLNANLKRSLVEAFSQIIINEYDALNDIRFPRRDIKDHHYMATRYLQLQHPDKRGLCSGDGRSIWNGVVRGNGPSGKTWDVTSCGTGATCLSPASAIHKKFFQSGDPDVSYGCGYAMVEEGFTDAMFSESLHLNGVATERVLCVIQYEEGYGVKVRAGLNLIRPSHFFLHLKQGQRGRLKAMADYYIDRQIANGTWAPVPRGQNKYDYLLEKMAETFARIAARFESDYIFCWLDWDGDNILADGGIVDFGSIRQFGLFHHEYRFDDDDRWSTNIKEQRQKARNTVQTFAQMVAFIKSGRKRSLNEFRKHKILRRFDHLFSSHKEELLLAKVGFNESQVAYLRGHCRKTIAKFESAFRYFERSKARRGRVRVADGISWDAVFCMRDILRELPVLLQDNPDGRLSVRQFIDILKSAYASRRDTRLTPGRIRQCRRFQDAYVALIRSVALFQQETPARVLAYIAGRSAVINRYERITGDGITAVGELLNNHLQDFSPAQIQQFIENFVARQNLNPDTRRKLSLAHSSEKSGGRTKVDELLEKAQAAIKSYREGL